MADAKTLVFIHGSDPKQALTPWMFFHLHPASYATPVLSEGKAFDLVYFDFELGTRKTWKGWAATRAKSPPSAAPDTSVELVPKVHIRDQSGALYADDVERSSVLAFYEWVKTQPERSIASIQIFSHAVIHQPVLFARSYEWGDDPDKHYDITAERDPNDTEFRLRDFEGHNPLAGGDPWAGDPSGELAKFRKALADDVFIKIWGCGEQTYSHNDGAPIRKLVTDYLAVKSGKAGDARRAGLVISYLDHVKEFFPYRLAERLELPVWAGPVGWGSDPNEVDGVYNKATFARDKYTWRGMFPPDLDRKELWWRLSLNFRSNKAFAEKFFKGALKARLDSLGYVEYRKSWVTAATDAANSTLAPAETTPVGRVLNAPLELIEQVRDQVRSLGGGSE